MTTTRCRNTAICERIFLKKNDNYTEATAQWTSLAMALGRSCKDRHRMIRDRTETGIPSTMMTTVMLVVVMIMLVVGRKFKKYSRVKQAVDVFVSDNFSQSFSLR